MNGNTPTARLLRVYSRRSKQQSTKSPPEAADSSEGALKDYNANMPGKKRSRGRKKKSSESQPKQTASTPSVPASTVKPAQYEKGTASSSSAAVAAAKLETSTTATTRSTSTAATSSVTNVGASTGAKVSGGVTTTTGSSKVTPQAPPVSPAKAPPVSTGTTGAVGGAGKPSTELVKPTDTSKVQSTAVSSSKPDLSKVTSSVTKPTATTVVSGTTGQKDDVKSKETKVKSEVSAKASTPAPAVDPLDALAGSLPSSKPSKSPQFTGPEVTEPHLTSDVAPRCGERDDTLPPGYRLKDMEKKMPAGQPEKPKEVSKPVTLDEAVDSLSAGFVSSPPPGASKPEVKHENVVAADSRKNYAPAPPAQKKQDVSVPTSLSPAPPADKKPKIEKPAKDSATAAAQDVKAKAEEKKISADKLQQGPKDVPMSPDPFDALSNTLPEAKPVPEPKKLRPEEIVDEKKLKSEKGVRVGEREDSLPPEYRHKPDKDMKQPPPPPPKQPSMDTTEALDILSGDFTDATVAPVVQSPVPPKAQDKQPKVEDLSALDALAGDFVAPVKGQKVCSGAPPAPPSTTKSTPPTSEQVDPMALDALDTLGDLLPKAKPAPESPKLRPEQIVEEAKLKSEKGVRVGERDDTLPPGYRFPKTDPKSQPPPPKKEPSMDPTEALDILSGDFTCAQAAPVVQACVRPSAPPASASMDFDLEELSGDFVAPKSASKVCSAATTTDKQADPMSLDALDVLGDSLPKAKPTPMSPILRPEEIVNEATLKSEKGVRVGERDDTLPPGYRFPKTDPKSQPPPPKKEPSMDPTEALDILSGDFTCAQAAPVVQACVRPSAPPASSSADFDLEELAGDFVAPTSASKVCSASSAPTAMDRQLSDGSSSAMDALSDTLKDIHPAPEPARVSPKDVVKEKDVVEERLHKPGERDDSLPPEFRPTEADIKAAAEAKGKAAAKKPSFDDAAALDALSSDFVSVVPGTSPAPQCQAPSVNTSSSQKKPAAADAPAVETLPAKPSSDVVSTSTTKKGGKS
ncbi:calpastatin isoform X7 [Tachysurus fulvidraco]|uniref:calpastatin isoform X7 n=1 Tax=Tachysurus fulvidraco TaxID=1234273 RepID=UPI001FEF89E1|nr:calpastatin isoform X7 [Tachysurus fulvidraco]XP_047661377.1 calpastatin isoform X7 [Tachysurus fulvidraco]